jgi:hypothetical protein
MKTHFAIQTKGAFGSTLTTTLCGRMNAKSADGMNSTTDRAEVTCAFCQAIFTDKSNWRHRKFLCVAA